MDQSDVVEFREVVEVSPTSGPVVDVAVVPPLTGQEDDFALAVIEFGGNIAKAYRYAYGDVSNPTARGRQLLNQANVALRIRDITESVQEHALVSLGAHLIELAAIRDLAKDSGQLKTALNAEELRGTVAGFYAGKMAGPGGKGKGNDATNAMAVIHIHNHVDRGI
jgi:hypothetical protein